MANSYTFVIYQDNAKKYRWRLKAGNGEIVADSGQGYTSKEGCKNGIALVQAYAAGASVEDTTEAKSYAASYRW